ncbi:MAG: outer membrane lipoprotein chaperone LolA, partial [Endozoicomonas sp.]
KLQKINTLSARFAQSSVDSKGQTKMEKGIIQLKKPDRFRWQVTEPFNQEIIAHGGKIWMLDPDFKQVVIKRQDASAGPTPVQLLSGDARRFLKDYRVVRMNYGEEVVYTLRPAVSSELFENLDIHFAGQQLSAISLKDSLGGKRRIDFSSVKVNGGVKDALFVPDIQRLKKEGFDVIDESGA